MHPCKIATGRRFDQQACVGGIKRIGKMWEIGLRIGWMAQNILPKSQNGIFRGECDMPPVTWHQGLWNIELLQYYGRWADDPVANFLDILPIVFNHYCRVDSWTLRLCIDNFFWLFLLGVFSKLNWPLCNFTNSFFTIGVLMATFPCASKIVLKVYL